MPDLNISPQTTDDSAGSGGGLIVSDKFDLEIFTSSALSKRPRKKTCDNAYYYRATKN